MPIPSDITDLSTNPSANSPGGAEPPTEGDNHIRTAYAFIRQLYDVVIALPQGAGSSLIGFIQAGTGAVSRTAQAKLREHVTPDDFGAVGDGVADDTVPVNQAFAASKRVMLTAGKVYSGGPFLHGDDQEIFGRGTLKAKTNLNNWVLTNINPGGGNTGLKLFGITIDGNKANQSGTSLLYGYYGSRLSNSLISGVTIKDCKEDGVLLGSSAFSQQCERVVVRDCIITGCARNGMSMIAADRCEFTDNVIVGGGGAYSTENAGIDIEADNSTVSVSYNLVARNIVMNYGGSGQAGRGYTCVNAVGGTMTGNRFLDNLAYNCGSHGYEIQDLPDGVVQGNTSTQCGIDSTQTTHGIYINNSDNVDVKGNKVTLQGTLSQGGSGVFVTLSDNVSVEDNRVQNNRGHGIDIRGSLNGVCSGNQLINNGVGTASFSGINLQTISAVVPAGWKVSGNKAYDTAGIGPGDGQQYGLAMTNSNANEIADNDFRGNRVAAVLESGTTNFIRNNVGYDPLGSVAAPSLPAALTPVTNTTNHYVQVFVEGGTNVVMIVGGTQVTGAAVAPPPPVIVAPGQTVAMNYSVIPTGWRWFRQ